MMDQLEDRIGFSCIVYHTLIIYQDFGTLSPLCSIFCLRMSHGHKFADHQVLLIEPLFPPTQRIHLLRIQIFKLIQRPLQVLRQHILIEATACQASTRVASRKVVVWTSWTIEVTTRAYVKDFSSNGEVDWGAVLAIVWQESWRCEGAEDDWWWGFGECNGRLWTDSEVDDECEERDED